MSFVPTSRIADAFPLAPATAAAVDADILIDCRGLAGRKTRFGLSPLNLECA